MRVLRWGRSAYETDAALDLERAGAVALELQWQHHPTPDVPAVIDRADALVVTSGVRVDRAALERFGGDLVVATTSGYDHVDLDACAERGVAVVRLPQARRDAVVEHTLASLLALARRLPALHLRSRDGHWARGDLPGLAPRALRGSRVVVVGLGVIGRAVAEALGLLGAAVIGVDPAGVPDEMESASLEDALSRAEMVTLHCSLTRSSRGLLDGRRLDLLSPGAVVVNTARGEVLDVAAAVDRVLTGRLGGLAVDVFPVEPYPALARMAEHPGLLFTPHSAGYTADLGERVAYGVIDALTAWVSGRSLPHRLV